MIDDVDRRLTGATVRCGARSTPRSAGSAGRPSSTKPGCGNRQVQCRVDHSTSLSEVGVNFRLPPAGQMFGGAVAFGSMDMQPRNVERLARGPGTVHASSTAAQWATARKTIPRATQMIMAVTTPGRQSIRARLRFSLRERDVACPLPGELLLGHLFTQESPAGLW